MVHYQLVAHPTAERELNALTNAQRTQLLAALDEIAATKQPTSHSKVRSLEGQPGLFRARTGDVRAILSLQKPELRVLAVGPRASVYENIDETLSNRRETPA